jgi:superfamily I DNA/RNA helicase
MPNVQVLTFTRPLAEFLKTGCYDEQNREIFPPSLITTLESWIRRLHKRHKKELPDKVDDLVQWKRALASSALALDAGKLLPMYDTIFVDESQDLVQEEVQLVRKWANNVFLVGDDCQKIYEGEGLVAVRSIIPATHERVLKFHYRLAPEICQVADRILPTRSGASLESTHQYKGPRPATVRMQPRLSRDAQIEQVLAKLREQVRVYEDLIRQGDRLGVIVARRRDRDAILEAIDADFELSGRAKIIRSKSAGDDYSPAFDPNTPINILTVKGCKGLEFRAVHWPFAEQLSSFHTPEHYYTVVTRAKTSLDVYSRTELPEVLARAYSTPGAPAW